MDGNGISCEETKDPESDTPFARADAQAKAEKDEVSLSFLSSSSSSSSSFFIHGQGLPYGRLTTFTGKIINMLSIETCMDCCMRSNTVAPF